MPNTRETPSQPHPKPQKPTRTPRRKNVTKTPVSGRHGRSPRRSGSSSRRSPARGSVVETTTISLTPQSLGRASPSSRGNYSGTRPRHSTDSPNSPNSISHNLKTSLQQLHQHDETLRRHLQKLNERNQRLREEEEELLRESNESPRDKKHTPSPHQTPSVVVNIEEEIKRMNLEEQYSLARKQSPRRRPSNKRDTHSSPSNDVNGSYSDNLKQRRANEEKRTTRGLNSSGRRKTPLKDIPSRRSPARRDTPESGKRSNSRGKRSPVVSNTPLQKRSSPQRSSRSASKNSPVPSDSSPQNHDQSPPKPKVTQVDLQNIPQHYYDELRKKQEKKATSAASGTEGRRLLQAMESLKLDLAQLRNKNDGPPQSKKNGASTKSEKSQKPLYSSSSSSRPQKRKTSSRQTSQSKSLSARGRGRTPSPHRNTNYSDQNNSAVMQSARESISQKVKRREQMHALHGSKSTGALHNRIPATARESSSNTSVQQSPKQVSSYLQYLDELRKKDNLRLKAASVQMKKKKIEKQKKKLEELKHKEDVKGRLAALNQYTRSIFHINTKDRYRPPASLKNKSRSKSPKTRKEESRASWLEVDTVKRIMRDPEEPRPPSYKKKRKPPLPNVFRAPSPKRVKKPGEGLLSARSKSAERKRHVLKRKSRPVFHDDLVNRSKTPKKRSTSQKRSRSRSPKRPSATTPSKERERISQRRRNMVEESHREHVATSAQESSAGSSASGKQYEKGRTSTVPSSDNREERVARTKNSSQESILQQEERSSESVPVSRTNLLAHRRNKKLSAKLSTHNVQKQNFMEGSLDSALQSPPAADNGDSEEDFAREMDRISDELISRDVEAILQNYSIIEKMESSSDEIRQGSQPESSESAPSKEQEDQEGSAKENPSNTSPVDNDREDSRIEDRNDEDSMDVDDIIRNLDASEAISELTEEFDDSDVSDLIESIQKNASSSLEVPNMQDDDNLAISKSSSINSLHRVHEGIQDSDSDEGDQEPVHAEINLEEDYDIVIEKEEETLDESVVIDSTSDKVERGNDEEDAAADNNAEKEVLSEEVTLLKHTKVKEERIVSNGHAVSASLEEQPTHPADNMEDDSNHRPGSELNGTAQKLLNDLDVQSTDSELSDFDESEQGQECKTQ